MGGNASSRGADDTADRTSVSLANAPASQPSPRCHSQAQSRPSGFGHKVCQVVQNLGCTSYVEVADSLVADLLGPDQNTDNEAKNIRRRVYDALNAAGGAEIIKKDKKAVM